MTKKKALEPKQLLPGNVRVVVQLYDAGRRVYSQPPGFSFTVPRVHSERELKRLRDNFQREADSGNWRDQQHREATAAAS